MSANVITTEQSNEFSQQEIRLQLVTELQESLISGDESKSQSLIKELARAEQESLFNEIGKLTRNLHDALGSATINNSINNILELNMSDARARLDYVVQKTEESANSTLTSMEDILPVIDKINDDASKMHKAWTRFTKREMQADEFRLLSKDIEAYFTQLENNTKKIHAQLNDVILAQGFQDLVGQVVQQVIEIVENVESGLVGIIKRTGHIEGDNTVNKRNNKKATTFGPQIDTTAIDVITNQDDVDDLLSSLGF